MLARRRLNLVVHYWRCLVSVNIFLYLFLNVVCHLKLTVHRKDSSNEVLSMEIRQQEEEIHSDMSWKESYSKPKFTREPQLRKGCSLQFVNPNMTLCRFGKTLESDVGIWIARRLLEYHYQCSIESLRIIDVKEQPRDGAICLWIQSSHHHISEDVVWGTNILATYRSPFHPAVSFSNLFQDYYWLPTQDYSKRPYLLKKRICFTDDLESFPDSDEYSMSEISHTKVTLQLQQDLKSFLQDMRLCDMVISKKLDPLFLADALGIPNLAMDPSSEEEYGQFVVETNRSWIGWDARKRLLPLSEHERKSLSISIAESFPYHLVRRNVEGELTNDSKILVIMIGSIRGGEISWNTFYRHMLDFNSADLALVIGQMPSNKKVSSLFQRAKYVYEFPEYKDWGEAIDLINGTNWRKHILPNVVDKWGTWGGVGDKPGSGAVIFMIRWYVAKFLVDYSLLEKYDRFVITRADHYYGCNLDLSKLDNEFMWIPYGEDYKFGVTDRHLICNRGQILKALDILPPIVTYPEKYVSPKFAALNPEQLLRLRWEQENLWTWVRRFDRVMFTCAVEGDTTRWTNMSNVKVKEGVFLKYAFEYEETTCICKTGPCNYPFTKKKMRVGYPQRGQRLV